MNFEDFDPGLFGRWGADGYCGEQACDDGGNRQAADTILLEIKSAEAAESGADLKASNDAIALIVRTLDKTDELQRKINDARDAEAERNLDEAQLRTLCDGLNRHIEARAAEIAAGPTGDGAVRAAAGRDDDGPG